MGNGTTVTATPILTRPADSYLANDIEDMKMFLAAEQARGGNVGDMDRVVDDYVRTHAAQVTGSFAFGSLDRAAVRDLYLLAFDSYKTAGRVSIDPTAGPRINASGLFSDDRIATARAQLDRDLAAANEPTLSPPRDATMTIGDRSFTVRIGIPRGDIGAVGYTALPNVRYGGYQVYVSLTDVPAARTALRSGTPSMTVTGVPSNARSLVETDVRRTVATTIRALHDRDNMTYWPQGTEVRYDVANGRLTNITITIPESSVPNESDRLAYTRAIRAALINHPVPATTFGYSGGGFTGRLSFEGGGT